MNLPFMGLDLAKCLHSQLKMSDKKTPHRRAISNCFETSVQTLDRRHGSTSHSNELAPELPVVEGGNIQQQVKQQ